MVKYMWIYSFSKHFKNISLKVTLLWGGGQFAGLLLIKLLYNNKIFLLQQALSFCRPLLVSVYECLIVRSVIVSPR